MSRTNQLLGLAIACSLFVACTGDIESPPLAEERIGTLTYLADGTRALYAQDCKLTSKTCTLPNNHGCVKLVVSIYGDGRVAGVCTKPDGTNIAVDSGRDLPLQCRSGTSKYNLECVDTRFNLAFSATAMYLDTYPSRSSNSFTRFVESGLGEDIPNGSAFLPESPTTPTSPTPTTPTTPTNPSEACKNKAKSVFAQKFNGVLQGEGLKFIYRSVSAGSSSGFFGNSAFQSNPSLICQAQKPACDAQPLTQGKCYCYNGANGGICRGAPMVDAALVASCSDKPAECTTDQWATAVWDASRGAVTWLQGEQDKANVTTPTIPNVPNGNANANNNNNNNNGGWGSWNDWNDWLGGFNTGNGGNGWDTGPDYWGGGGWSSLEGAGGWGDIFGSDEPLILDLDDTGINLSAPADGVRFDFTGLGTKLAAWPVSSGNAFLCMDLNGNGKIDDGRELFGDAFILGTKRARDGFDALSALDDPRNGGNGDGLVDAKDRLFSQLRVWQDENRDGVSQPGELRTLAAAGVSALTLKAGHTFTDRHGNDMTQGSFIKANGERGMMVDAWLGSRRK